MSPNLKLQIDTVYLGIDARGILQGWRTSENGRLEMSIQTCPCFVIDAAFPALPHFKLSSATKVVRPRGAADLSSLRMTSTPSLLPDKATVSAR